MSISQWSFPIAFLSEVSIDREGGFSHSNSIGRSKWISSPRRRQKNNDSTYIEDSEEALLNQDLKPAADDAKNETSFESAASTGSIK